MRTFSDEVNRVSDDNLLHRHPEHYQLFYIGLFDDESGLFEPVPPEFITAGLDVLIDRSMI